MGPVRAKKKKTGSFQRKCFNKLHTNWGSDDDSSIKSLKYVLKNIKDKLFEINESPPTLRQTASKTQVLCCDCEKKNYSFSQSKSSRRSLVFNSKPVK